MELQLKKQWSSKQQHESETQKHSPNMPKILHQHTPPSVSALPLFVPKLSTLSPFSHSTLPAPTFPRVGSCFNFAQWQELELQALIFRYILAGAVVPPELLQPIKKSFLLQHYHPALLESGYWGRVELDPEPGRCRRTDGKKWRCSRDTVEGQKYCDRHMHRGRNRSRKHVEQSSPGISKSLFDSHVHVDGDGKSDGHVLRHFLDDWPRTLQENDIGESNRNRNNSGTCLSISTPGITSSDVSLTLSTGHGEDKYHVASMGGPLAEALRSPSSTSSPTSVLLRPASLVPKS